MNKIRITFASWFDDYEIKQNDNDVFLDNIKYFWEEKENIERYVDFDLERLRKLKPEIANQYEIYKTSKKTLDILIKTL